MLSPHLTAIQIKREEPENLDTEEANTKLTRQFSILAERIVLGSWLRTPPSDKVKQKKTQTKIKKMIEFDQRKDSTKKFLECWNYWRGFYFDAPPIQPKNLQQVSTIENAINFARENGLQLEILVACIHKHHEKKKNRPNFSAIQSYGLEAYDKWFDDVIADAERRRHEEGTL